GEVTAHADSLRALPGKHECPTHLMLSPPPRTADASEQADMPVGLAAQLLVDDLRILLGRQRIDLDRVISQRADLAHFPVEEAAHLGIALSSGAAGRPGAGYAEDQPLGRRARAGCQQQ